MRTGKEFYSISIKDGNLQGLKISCTFDKYPAGLCFIRVNTSSGKRVIRDVKW